MKNIDEANRIIDSLVDLVASSDEGERIAGYEWKRMGIEEKIKVFGIIAHLTGHARFKDLFQTCNIIKDELLGDEGEEKESQNDETS